MYKPTAEVGQIWQSIHEDERIFEVIKVYDSGRVDLVERTVGPHFCQWNGKVWENYLVQQFAKLVDSSKVLDKFSYHKKRVEERHLKRSPK